MILKIFRFSAITFNDEVCMMQENDSIPACRAFHKIELSGKDSNIMILFGG